MNQFYTYLHCRPDGTPFYVGKGFGKRSSEFHSGRSQHHKNIVAKYGKKNIKVFIFPCDSESQAFSDEIQQIKQLRIEGYVLANKTDGGEGVKGLICTPESRAKMVAAFTPERRKKLSDLHIGNKKGVGGKGSKGYRFTEQQKQQLSKDRTGKKKAKGYKQTEDHKRKISVANKGKIKSPETCKKLSAALKGNKNRLNRHHAKETCIKISKALTGKKLSESHCKSISIAQKGKILSQETKHKMSLASKGIPKSENHKINISKGKKGRPWSDAQRKASQNINNQRMNDD